MVILSGLSQFEGPVFMATITAPGADVLPWGDPDREGHHHSGPAGCVVAARPARYWNRSAPERWRGLLQDLRNSVRPVGPFVLAYAWEGQARGIAHVHPVFPLRYRDAVIAVLPDLARKWGFGYVDRRPKIRPGARGIAAAAYLASYFGNRGKLEKVLDDTREGVIPRRGFFVSRSLTAESGVTMRRLRLRRRAWAHLVLGVPAPEYEPAEVWGRVVEEVRGRLESRGPPVGVAA